MGRRVMANEGKLEKKEERFGQEVLEEIKKRGERKDSE